MQQGNGDSVNSGEQEEQGSAWHGYGAGWRTDPRKWNRMGDSTGSDGDPLAETQASKSNWSSRSDEQGEWFWTPQCWVWGRNLESAVQDYVAKKWIIVDKDFAQWWSTVEDDSASKQEEASGHGGDDARRYADGYGSSSQSACRGPRSTSGSDGKPNRGKDYIPVHDGSLTMREYERRVRLFQATTAIDLEYQAGKLIEKLQGAAWDCVETLSMQEVSKKDGVEVLLRHLWR